jgi:hypothetical protein
MAVSRSAGVITLCILVLLVSGSRAAAQVLRGWEHYQPGSIAAVIQANDSTIRADHDHLPSIVISGNKFPTLARVTYCGNSRPLDEQAGAAGATCEAKVVKTESTSSPPD